MNNYYYKLDVPFDFKPNYLKPEPDQHNFFGVELIDQSLVNWLAERDVVIMGCEQFLLNTSKRKFLPIHIDNPRFNDHTKLNYVFCDTPHRTTWYKLKPGKEVIHGVTAVGTEYAMAPEDDCEELFSTQIVGPCLFNASILHGVSPVESDRYCFSFTLAHESEPTKSISWELAESIFKDCIIS